MTSTHVAVAGAGPGPGRQSQVGARASRRRTPVIATIILLIGSVYTLIPVLWVVIASTKSRAELFTTFTFAPSFSGGLVDNLGDLFAYRDGVFLHWVANTVLYAVGGSLLSLFISALAGYALAKFRFPGREFIFRLILAGVLVPQITLAIPQYLLLAQVNMVGTYWSVLLPSLINPFGIYLCRIFAAAAVPDQMLEAGRVDGANEYRMFWSLGLPAMVPGLVTVFLLQFIAIWNNFLLPFIMLSDDERFPLTVGLFALLNQGTSQPALYALVITGALLSILPLIALFLVLQRYWRIDVLSGALKG